MGFVYEIQFKQGKDNQDVDALSRSPLNTTSSPLQLLEEVQLTAISYPYSTWIDDLHRHSEGDPWVISKKQLVCSVDNDAIPIANYKFQFDNGILKYKGGLY